MTVEDSIEYAKKNNREMFEKGREYQVCVASLDGLNKTLKHDLADLNIGIQAHLSVRSYHEFLEASAKISLRAAREIYAKAKEIEKSVPLESREIDNLLDTFNGEHKNLCERLAHVPKQA